MKITTLILGLLFIAGCTSNRKIIEEKITIQTHPEQISTPLEIEVVAGKYHNHPSFAVWVEDMDGNYIETLYVTQYVAKGIFGHGELAPGRWSDQPGPVRRPASLPYWSHKRNIRAEDGLYIPSPETAVPDALTGATPKGSFVLETGTGIENRKFRILFEINQPWDSNRYWTNNKFPEDNNYHTSLQPALVYEATIDPAAPQKEYAFQLIGHSHPTGATGELFSDLSTITTAKEIVQNITARLK